MTTANPFKKGDRVRRTSTGDLGTVIGAIQVKEDQFTTRRVHTNTSFWAKYQEVKTASKGDWKIGVHWDWEKEKYGDRVPKVTDPEFAQYHTVQWQWHKRHKRWILAEFLEPIAEEGTVAEAHGTCRMG